ncbi:PDZ and LIM domain protein Zasp-like [Atheta coriaria]|uniref:PDZ and LIM domain protein Zasp-like n=1 Tax=Dalotia coriaria TaxID=877792 RepID=UPI0031F36428
MDACVKKVEVVENVVWPPYQEDLNTLPTASPLYFPPSTHVHVKTSNSLRKSKSLVAACEFSTEDHQEEQFQSDCVTSQTESESDYQDLEDYSNFLRSMEPKMSLTSAEVYNINGRRSTIECAQALADHLQTAMLVDSVMKSQRPRSPPPLSADAPSAVKKPPPPKPKMESPITPVCPLKCQQSCCNECPECPMNKPAELRRLSELERFEEMRAKIQNNVAQGWESQMVSALRTTPDVPFCASPDLSQLPTRSPRGPMASAMTIAPPKPFQPIQSVVPVFNTKPVPLPEETVPYLPPERPLIPELQKPKPQERREEEPRGSPFVEALKTAPQRPFSPIVGTGQPPTPIRPKKKSDPFLKDLPKPQEKLTMLAALTTASDRTYSPMTVDYTGGEMRVMTYEQKREEEEAKELKELEEKRRFSIKQPIPQPFIGRMVETFEGGNPGQKTPDANFPPVSVELQGASEYHADYQEVKSELSSQITQQQDRALQMQREVQQMQAQVQSSQKVYEQHQTYEAQQTYQSQQESHEGHVCCIHQKECQLAKKREIAKQNEEVILKKPLTLAQSLHKQDQIPSYQSALQFEEQIQLPHHKDIKQLLKPEERSKIVPNPRPLLRADPHHNMATPPPKIIAPVSVVTPGEHSPNPRASFQTVNDNFQPPSSAISQRLGQSTPSKMNKTPSAIPYYQQNLVATQFLAPEINVFDPSSPAMSRSPSPCPGAKPERDRPNSPFRKPPSRPKSPAAGPPPNPLKKHQDPAGLIKDVQVEKAKDKVTSYIPHHQEKYQTIQTREGDYYDQSRVVDYSQNRSQINEPNFQQQTQQARAYEADATQKHHVHFEGNAKVSTKEQSASERKQELNKTQAQSTQVSADGRTKVQRKKTVVEEFEQSHKEKSIEIQKTYPFERVNAPIPIHEEQGMQGLHVTNPKQIHSPFLGQPIQGPPPMPKNPIPVAPKFLNHLPHQLINQLKLRYRARFL